MPSTLFRSLLATALLGLSLGAAAAPVKTEHVEAELIAERASVQPGKPFTVALRIKHAPHWHTYWRNPGDSGLSTKIDWKLPKDHVAGPIQWPHPKRLPLGPLMNFGYENELLLLTDITPPKGLKAGDSIDIAAKADWLVCKDVCIPENGAFSLKLPVQDAAPAPSVWASAFTATRALLPVAAEGWQYAAAVQGKNVVVTLTPDKGLAHQPKDVFFYPYQEGVMENAQPQPVKSEGGKLVLTAQLTDPVAPELKAIPGILVSQNGWGKTQAKAVLVGNDPGQANITPAAFTASAKPPVAPASPGTPNVPPGSDLGLWLALLFAFIGGLILNLMPCVFPVLGIKVMSFVQHAHEDSRILRNQGLVFLAGVVVSFWVLTGILLALKAGGQSLGWGFQLQSPAFVTVLAILFTLMALNLFGVFEVGLGLQSAAGNVSGKGIYGEAFLSGVLATVVATPCTAPFMGAALGFTLSQPAYVALMVFTALALGMAAPVTLLALFPAGLKWLPRPGAWMATFKQFMAFPLLATVVWLAWVLGTQQGNEGVMKLLAGLVLVGMAAWAYGRWGMHGSKAGMAFAAVLLAGGIAFAWPGEANVPGVAGGVVQAKAGELPWEPWSKAKLEQLRAEGKPVFVDFTASWCITCQVNKRVALHNEAVVKRFADQGVVALKADWTRQDPAITAALAEFGRNAVPLYVVYGVNGAAPVVLPEVLTPALVLAELEKAGGAAKASRQAAAK
jgi:thiol:disulfide interchange protein/DsbC/DsbD-like thiol-disulfide interchange protein